MTFFRGAPKSSFGGGCHEIRVAAGAIFAEGTFNVAIAEGRVEAGWFRGIFDALQDGAFEAKKSFHDPRLVGEAAEGYGVEDARRGAWMERTLALNLFVEDAGFENEETHVVAAGGGQGRDIGVVCGVSKLRQGILRIEAVTAGIAAAAAFSGFGDGSAGSGAVETRCGALLFSSHGGPIMHDGRVGLAVFAG